MKISKGLKDSGIVVGNLYNKYGSSNPVVKWIMKGFQDSLSDLVASVKPDNIHEIGCGEGYWVLQWQELGINARGSDFSAQVIDLAKQNAKEKNINPDIFSVKSIYDIKPVEDSADLIVCCEVLEHLEDPHAALKALQGLVKSYIILSVPRERIWCTLNLVRGKYILNWGNTPGHIQHWSKRAFLAMIEEYFKVIQVRTPLPWTMVLAQPIKNQ